MTATPPSWRRSVSAGVSGNIAGTLPFFLTATLALRLGDDLGFGERGLGALLAVFAVGGTFSAPLIGRVAERLGPELGLRVSAIASGSLLILMGLLVRDTTHLAAFLVIAGVNATLTQAAGNLWLMRALGGVRLGFAFGLKQSGAPAAALLAGLAVPSLGAAAGWRVTFVGLGAVALAASVLVPRTGHRGSGLAAPSRAGDVSLGPLVMVAIGMGLSTATAASFIGFAVSAAVEQTRLTESAAAVLYAIGAVIGVSARVGLGRLVDRRSHSLFAMSALLVGSGGLGFVALASGTEAGFIVGVPFAFATAWGWTGVFNQAVTLANANSPAAATGITQAGGGAGVIIGPAAFGLLVGWSFTAAWLLAAIGSLSGAATILYGWRLIERDTESRRMEMNDQRLKDIARRLVAANERGFLPGRAAVHELVTDPVEIFHVPEWPGDGPMGRDRFLAIGEDEDRAWREAMPDFRQEEVSASVSGDVIELKRTLRGTLADGSDVRIPLRNLYSVADGRVTRIVPHLEPGLMDEIRRVLGLGGFDTDAEYET